MLICLTMFFFMSQTVCLSAEPSPAGLQKKMENLIREGQRSQKKADAWAEERRGILDQIRELKQQRRWLKHQQGKYQTYVEKQQEAIAELERRKKETEQIKMSLEPFLDELFLRLKAFVESDLPFLPQERQKRLRFLKDTLDNYHLGLAEKTRRILETLQVEASYGGTVEKTEAAIELENGLAQVHLFRLGRTALFYQSPDGNQVGWFDREKGKWEVLPAEYSREITRASEIAEKKRTPVLLDLPIRRPQDEGDLQNRPGIR